MAMPAEKLKKAANLSIRADLLEVAKELEINLSAEFEKHLADVVRKKLEQQWLSENKTAIAAYNRWVDKNADAIDALRTF